MNVALQRVLLTVFLTCLWSHSFLFIKLAIAEIPATTVAALRVTLAAVLMGVIMIWQRRLFPKGWMFWLHTTLFAALSAILPFCMFCYAEQTIDSALAAILNGTTPMFTAVLASLFVPTDRLDAQKGTGIALGMIGMSCLFFPALPVLGAVRGMIAALTGAFCYAASHVYAKKYFSSQEPFVAPTAQLLVSSLILIPMALWLDRSYSLPMPSASALFGVAGLSLFGTFIAYIIYYRLLAISGPTALSMTACFMPVGGMILGYLFLDEAVTIGGIFAAGLILVGMALVNDLIKLRTA